VLDVLGLEVVGDIGVADQMEASVVRADMIDFPINELLNQPKDEATPEMAAAGAIRGDLILTDYSLPVDVAAAAKDNLLRGIPVQIVTSGTSVGTMLEIGSHDREVGKPVKDQFGDVEHGES
jgi:hypothetical protein